MKPSKFSGYCKQEVVKTQVSVNKYGEIIPLKFGYGYDKRKNPIKYLLMIGNYTSNYLKGVCLSNWWMV